MIFYLDIRRDLVTLAAIKPAASKAAKGKWLQMKGDNKVGAALAKARRAFGWAGKKRPSAIVVAMNAPDVTPETRNVSWSGIRQGVATANALAFAWDAPLAAMTVRGDESRETLEGMIRVASTRAKAGEWVRAAYDGEPNITVAKKVL